MIELVGEASASRENPEHWVDLPCAPQDATGTSKIFPTHLAGPSSLWYPGVAESCSSFNRAVPCYKAANFLASHVPVVTANNEDQPQQPQLALRFNNVE